MTKSTKTTNAALESALAAQLPVVAPKPSKKPAAKVAAKKEPAKKVAAKAAPAKKTAKAEPEVKAPREGSKAAIAETIYLAGVKAGKTRQEILAAFVEHAKLTPAGSGTYYSNLRKKHG